MKKVSTLGVSVLAAFATPSLFALEVDQQQLEIDASRSVSFYATGQSFSPSVNLLNAIEIFLADGDGSSTGGDVYLTLHQQGPTGVVIAQTDSVYLEDCFNFDEGSGCHKTGGISVPVIFEFPQAVSLDTHQNYAFSIHSRDGVSFSAAYTYDSSYESGQLYLDNISQPQDLAFKTFSPEGASDINQESVLVMGDNTLYRYSYSGALLDTQQIPKIYQTENARDIVPISETDIAVFNGQFSPNLSIFNGNSWTHKEFEGWSTVANVAYGGIAADSVYVYLTDMSTGSGGGAQGIVRYDREQDTFERFLTDSGFIDITLGEDGMLYALMNVYGRLAVINPVNMVVERELELGHLSSSRAATADKDGTIYLAAWNGEISKFDSEGNLISSVSTGEAYSDIDIRGDHILLSSYYEEQALLYTTELEPIATFPAGGRHTFAAFSYLQPQAQIPEPDVIAEVSVSSDWNSGYCASLVITNATEAPQVWDIAIDIEGTVTNLWNASWIQSGPTLAVSGYSWNNTLQPGETNASVGFCANR